MNHAIAAIAALALFLVGCSPISSKSDAKVVCREKVQPVPNTWQRQQVGGKFFFFLPACFSEVQETQYVHGGQRWKCESMTAEVVWGMWGNGSFGENHDECATRINGKSVVVLRKTQDDHSSAIAWYRTGNSYEPIISVWSERAEDKDTILSVALSGLETDK